LEDSLIKAVLWDLDGTLFDRDSSVRRLVAAQYTHFAPSLQAVSQAQWIERFMALDARGYVPKPEVYRSLLDELGITGVTSAALFAHWQAHYHDRCLLYPGAAEVLETLARDGLALGIVTNGGFPWQLRTVQALGIQHLFSTILISEAEGIRKPDAAMFERAVHRLSVAPDETIFIGDHPVVDIAGARNAGLKAIWKRDAFWQAPAACDGVVDDLRQLPRLLEKLCVA